MNLQSTSTNDSRTAETGNAGQFCFTFLKPESYFLSAITSILKTNVAKLLVDVGQALNVSLMAKISATQQTVEVSADTTLIDTETAHLSDTFSAKQIQELPAPGGDLTTVAFWRADDSSQSIARSSCFDAGPSRARNGDQ